MPLYDYKCQQHGLFKELAAMADSALPCACPVCGASSARVIVIPPEVLAMAPQQKQAIERNEKAREKPVLSTVQSRADQAAEAADRAAFAARKSARHAHGPGCGCGSRTQAGGLFTGENERDVATLKQQVIYLPDGSKVFPSQRPWMISH